MQPIDSIETYAYGISRILQSCAKYIKNFLGFTKNLDLKYKFNVDFWLFSIR